MKKILVMGLPGAGKTYLAQYMLETFERERKKVAWLNADVVRGKFNDWDFSIEGRIRQSTRMRELAELNSLCDYVICDFIAPLEQMRKNFAADITVWMDTIKSSVYKDTDTLFQPPEVYNFRVTKKQAARLGEYIAASILDNRIGYKCELPSSIK